MAIEIGMRVYNATGGNVTFTGHSLGGGLAAAAALKTGGKTITFNAAGVHPWTSYRRNPNIKAYFLRGEILSKIQDFFPLPKAPGVRISMAPNNGNPISWHFLDSYEQ